MIRYKKGGYSDECAISGVKNNVVLNKENWYE